MLRRGADKTFALELGEVAVVGAPGETSGGRKASHARSGIDSGRNKARVTELANLLKIRHREGVLWSVEDTSGSANLVFEDGLREKVDLREIAKNRLGA